jgi:hypothetical protein
VWVWIPKTRNGLSNIIKIATNGVYAQYGTVDKSSIACQARALKFIKGADLDVATELAAGRKAFVFEFWGIV